MNRYDPVKCVAVVLKAAFPEACFTFWGEKHTHYSAAAGDGLLPLLARQAEATAVVIGDIPGFQVIADGEALSGFRVLMDEAPPALALPFILDAALIAAERSPFWLAANQGVNDFLKKNFGDGEFIVAESIEKPLFPDMNAIIGNISFPEETADETERHSENPE
jgi:hypothetical protein